MGLSFSKQSARAAWVVECRWLNDDGYLLRGHDGEPVRERRAFTDRLEAEVYAESMIGFREGGRLCFCALVWHAPSH